MNFKSETISRRWGSWVGIVLGIFIMMGATINEADQQKQPAGEIAPAPAIPKPQFFCGSCHVLTYPAIIQQQAELWKKSKHKEVGCVKCHYQPDKSSPDGKEMITGHLPKQPPEYFTYLKLGGSIVQTCPNIDNATCMTAECHGKVDDDFKTKKIKYTEKVTFIHQPHLEAKNQIGGQKLNCTNCHQHETDLKKFEVSKETCFLCHFMGTKLNDGKSRCEICHTLPKEPIRATMQQAADSWGSDQDTSGSQSTESDTWGSDEKPSESKPAEPDTWASDPKPSDAQPADSKPITHAMLKDAGVSCFSCHFDLVRSSTGATYSAFFENGVLKTAVVYGVGRIKKENCKACHDKRKDLKEAMAMELMHQQHVTTKTARCLDCHQPVTHIHARLEERMPQEDDPVLLDGCTTCHPLPHYYQRVLTTGAKNPADNPAPDPMYSTRVNCLGCHNEQVTLPKGQTVLKASEKMCVSCHERKYEKTLEDWKAELIDKMRTVYELEQQILKTLNNAITKPSKDQLDEIMHNLGQALENFKIVKHGNGVHNIKYSLMLLDESIEKLKELNGALANNKS